MYKKVTILSLSLAAALLTPYFALAVNFSDVSLNNNYELPIHFLRSKGMVAGFPDNTYRPEQFLSKGNAARVILTAYQNSPVYHLDVPDLDPSATFPDMLASDASAKYLVKAAQLGVFGPDANGYYHPGESITRAELMRLFLIPSAIDLSDLQGVQLYDDVFPSSSYTQYMNFAGKYGMLVPDLDNRLYPSNYVSRGEAAEIGYALFLIVRKDDTTMLLTQLHSHIDKAFYFLDQQNYLSAKRTIAFAVGIGQMLYNNDPNNTSFLANAKLAKAVSYFVNYWLINSYANAETYQQNWLNMSKTKLNDALQVDAASIQTQADELQGRF